MLKIFETLYKKYKNFQYRRSVYSEINEFINSNFINVRRANFVTDFEIDLDGFVKNGKDFSFMFNDKDFIEAPQILRHFKEINLISFQWNGNLKDISSLRNLISANNLIFNGCSSLEDLTPLKNLKDVKSLGIFGIGSKTLDGLENVKTDINNFYPLERREEFLNFQNFQKKENDFVLLVEDALKPSLNLLPEEDCLESKTEIPKPPKIPKEVLDYCENIFLVHGEGYLEKSKILMDYDGLIIYDGDVSFGITKMSYIPKIFKYFKEIKGELSFSNLDKLQYIYNFENLKSVGSITILRCDMLKSIEGLCSLEHISKDFIIFLNPKLENLKPLQNLKHIGGSFFLGNDKYYIKSLEGLENLEIDIEKIFPIEVRQEFLFFKRELSFLKSVEEVLNV